MPGTKVRILASIVASASLASVGAFSANAPSAPTTVASVKSKSPMFEYLKFDKNPQFDVLAKTQEYLDTQTGEGPSEDWYADDYVLRGPVVGPLTRKDLKETQEGLGIVGAFPDIRIDSFGLTIDPENPYRCFYFQRWRGTHTEDLNIFGGQTYPATGNEMECPLSCFCVVWNPEGKIVYEQVGAVIDRFEGNTQGKAAVFGMLHTAGLDVPANPGDKVFAFIQKFTAFFGLSGRASSREEDIPKWWTSKSRGADPTDN